MKIGIYAGTFDPITVGHMDIIERASKIVDELIIGLLFNPNKKNTLFTVEERIEMIKECVKHIDNVKVYSFSGLLVDLAKKCNANVIIRGMRVVTDFEYEMQMAQLNKRLAEEIETIFLLTSAKYSFLSSSSVRELVYFKELPMGLVPDYVIGKLKEKMEKD